MIYIQADWAGLEVSQQTRWLPVAVLNIEPRNWIIIYWEKYLETAEQLYVSPPQMIDPCGSIFSKSTTVHVRFRQKLKRCQTKVNTQYSFLWKKEVDDLKWLASNCSVSLFWDRPVWIPTLPQRKHFIIPHKSLIATKVVSRESSQQSWRLYASC
jgi:hypothetical protein